MLLDPRTIANSADGYKKAADQYNTWGQKAKRMGLKFGFHNHNVEFKDYGDVTGFDVLMKNTDPALVQWQMDCYWVAQAGHDPVAMLRRYGKRMQSLHVKDRKPNVPPRRKPERSRHTLLKWERNTGLAGDSAACRKEPHSQHVCGTGPDGPATAREPADQLHELGEVSECVLLNSEYQGDWKCLFLKGTYAFKSLIGEEGD